MDSATMAPQTPIEEQLAKFPGRLEGLRTIATTYELALKVLGNGSPVDGLTLGPGVVFTEEELLG